MDRKDFFKKACLMGICGCAGLSLFTASGTFASIETPGKDDPDWRIGFMQKRFSKLMELLASSVDETTKTKILEGMGRECARQALEKNKKFIGDIDGFLKNMESSWAEKASYDKDKKEIKIVGKKAEKCFCPFAGPDLSKDFCSCSIGWQKETMGTILGKEVGAHIDSSVLRGGTSCNFTIKVL